MHFCFTNVEELNHNFVIHEFLSKQTKMNKLAICLLRVERQKVYNP